LVVKGLAQIGVGKLALDRNAEQPGEAGKEVHVGNVELAGVRTIDLEDTKRPIAFAAGSRDRTGALVFETVFPAGGGWK
jgi:hypothetical protein